MVGFFDFYAEDDDRANGGSVSFLGTWSHQPYFETDYILVAFVREPLLSSAAEGAVICTLTGKEERRMGVLSDTDGPLYIRRGCLVLAWRWWSDGMGLAIFP